MNQGNRIKIGLLGAVVSLLALAFIFAQVNMMLVLDALRSANYLYIVPTLALLLLGLITRAFRWQVLLANALPFWRVFSIMNVAYLVNGVLPLRIGEVARVYLASRVKVKHPVTMMQTTSTIIVERLLDLLAVGVMVLCALVLGPVPDQIRMASAAGVVISIVGFLTLILLATRRDFAHAILRWIIKLLPILQRWSLHTWANHFLDGLMPLTRPAMFTAAVGWTVLSWLLSIASGYVLMFAFFETGHLAATMLYIAAAAFAIALPAVPGNIGTYEASILLALTALGYANDGTAVAFAVMVHAVNVFAHASTGFVGLLHEGISIGQLTQGVRGMQQTTTEIG